MPAMLDDPSAPTIYRTSGSEPFPDPHNSQPFLPEDIYPRQVTLRDRITIATIIPFSSQHNVPRSLLAYLSDQLNKEIDMGDTYPMTDTMSVEKFSSYWFQNFGAIMFMGSLESAEELTEGENWATKCLGSYYIKPNYPGRSSHVSNAGFLVTEAARNKGAGRLLGESYLDWAPRLGYTYSVFNLVYETNVASCRIWDALGFKRIGKVKGAGNMKSYPGQLIDAIIYGRDLGPDGYDFVSEERFDKIAYYLRFGKYPAGADRAEKSRLRSAATHYKLLENDKLMLRDREVISDAQKQYEIARNVHLQHHGGINKTTATIAEKFHWTRIKETVSLVIRNCTECKELGKTPTIRAEGVTQRRPLPSSIAPTSQGGVSAAGRTLSLAHQHSHSQDSDQYQDHHPHHQQTSVSPQVLNRPLPGSTPSSDLAPHQTAPITQMQTHHTSHPHPHPHPHPHHQTLQNDYMPLDPQIMEDVRTQLGSYNSQSNSHAPPHDYNTHHDLDSFQAMLSRQGDGNDLDMLIDQEDEDEEGEVEDVASGLQIRVEAASRAAEEAMRFVEPRGGLLGREFGKG
jgi:GNAT superfamily N-acetyltransferase